MEQGCTILFSPNEAYGQSAAQLAACGFVANASVQAGVKDVQLGFAHRAFQAEQQAIVEQRRVINAVGVTNENIGFVTAVENTAPSPSGSVGTGGARAAGKQYRR